MSGRRLTMRKIREILRWKWELSRSHRDVAKGLGVSLGRVSSTWNRAKVLGLGPSDVSSLTDDELEAKFYGPQESPRREKPLPDFLWIHGELKRKGVTLELLHEEYLERNRGGYSYSRFCELYDGWRKKQRISMRQVHRAGEKTFVDYSGMKPFWVDPKTGNRVEEELFVAVLGASNLTFAEVTADQRVPEFVTSHVHAFEYFDGVTEIVVPDELKSGVSRPNRYEPEVQRTYAEMAEHYGTVVIPARPRKPKDKAKAEVGVQVAERWILARLRHRVFFSHHDLATGVIDLREQLNDRVMKSYGKSRRQLYELWDRPALLPLPEEPYVFAVWKIARVNIDCHVEADHHYYSAPFPLVHEKVDVRMTATTVEIFHRGTRVASHLRSYERGRYTTVPEHLPASHRAHLEWSPSRLIAWGASIGEKTAELVQAILESRPHPEQGYRSCLGLLRLSKQYGATRLEAACARGVAVGVRSYRRIDSILKNGLDRMPLFDTTFETEERQIEHENIRGPAYYREEG